MKNITKFLAIMAMLTFSNTLFAEVKYGVSAAVTQIKASGTETEGGEKNSKSVDHYTVIPSIFAEYVYGNITVGLDYIPMSADVSDKTKTRSDTETSVTGNTAVTSTARTQSAQAELKQHVSLYGSYAFDNDVFIKLGAVQVDLNTTESLATGSKYGNETITGTLVGIGFNSGNIRTELLYTDYEDISLRSSVARTGVTTNNLIEADLDTTALKISYVF